MPRDERVETADRRDGSADLAPRGGGGRCAEVECAHGPGRHGRHGTRAQTRGHGEHARAGLSAQGPPTARRNTRPPGAREPSR